MLFYFVLLAFVLTLIQYFLFDPTPTTLAYSCTMYYLTGYEKLLAKTANKNLYITTNCKENGWYSLRIHHQCGRWCDEQQSWSRSDCTLEIKEEREDKAREIREEARIKNTSTWCFRESIPIKIGCTQSISWNVSSGISSVIRSIKRAQVSS